MESYSIFRDLAIIIVFAKVFGIIARKCKAPQVVGEIIAGLLIGPSVLGLVQQSDFLIQMAEIGVILLMFSAGLETNLKDLMKTGFVAFLIACMGVFVPLVGGTLLYMGFYGVAPWGSEKFYEAVFIGVIMTATSVSITVQSLKELGKLKKPILLKRGLSATIEEWLMSAEYIMSEGNENVILCERGIRTFETYTRNTLDLSAVQAVKRLSHLPVIVDPSHATGKAWMVPTMSKAAIAAGADGLIIETHNDPQHAWCDGAQSLSLPDFDKLMQDLRILAPAVGREL